MEYKFHQIIKYKQVNPIIAKESHKQEEDRYLTLNWGLNQDGSQSRWNRVVKMDALLQRNGAQYPVLVHKRFWAAR